MSANIWLLKWRVLPFKVSLADVMQEEVFSSLVKGDLPAKVDNFPSSLGSSRMTILFKTHARRSLHVHDSFSPQGSMGLPCYLAT